MHMGEKHPAQKSFQMEMMSQATWSFIALLDAHFNTLHLECGDAVSKQSLKNYQKCVAFF